MAFEGNLRDLEFGDVVQTLSMTRQYGTLVVRGPEERRVAFTERGMVLLSARPSHGERVGRYLLGRGRVTADALETARRATRRATEAALGDALLEAGAVTEEHLAEARRYVAEDDLFDLFRWSEGQFEFHADDLQLSGPFASLSFDVGAVAMEAARRIDEAPLLEAVVPLGEVLMAGAPESAPREGEAKQDMLRLYAAANGRRTVGNIVKEYHLGEFDTRKHLASLIECGALRPATAEEILAVVSGIKDRGRAARLLRRAVELDPTSAAAWSKLAKALAASGDKAAAADALSELASLQYSVGQGESALGTLRAALKMNRQCITAHSLLTRTLLALQLVDEAVAAARDAVTESLAADEPQAALDIALAALEYVPDDVRLARSSAAAYAALGRTAEAVAVLDRIAHDLSKVRAREKELIAVYRSILSIAPERADCQEQLEAIAHRAAARKRRRRQLIALAAGVVLAGAIAVPTMMGSNVRERLDEMNRLVDAGELDGVQVLLNELRDEDIEEELLAKAAAALSRKVEQSKRPPLDQEVPRRLKAHIDERYAVSREALAALRMTDGLAALIDVIVALSSDDMKAIAPSSPETAQEIIDSFDSEVRSALTETAENCLAITRTLTLAVDEFEASEALERAELTIVVDDLDELAALAERANEVEAIHAANDWDALEEQVATLIEAAKSRPREFLSRASATIQNLTTTLDRARDLGERAVAHSHKLRLFTEFRTAKNRGAKLVAEGNVEEAAELYRSYVEFCDESLALDRGATYERIVQSYMDTFQLRDLLRERLAGIENIVAREKAADEALAGGDVAAAFDLRVGLVREFPQVGFSVRFALPLRIESRPPGADILLVTPDGERPLGRTTSIVEYPAVGDSEIAIRLDGFDDVVLERRGAFGDADADELIELMKRPLWRSAPGAATESAATAWRDRAIITDRNGVVRAMSLDDGRELGRLETGLLGGFASTAVVLGDRLYAASVDGVGFVLDPETLEIVHRFELDGAVRTALLATSAGVVVIDDRGQVHLIGPDGTDVWTRDVGVVVVDPAATTNSVVIVTIDGTLIELSLASGDEIHRVALRGAPRWSAPTLADGHAYVASESGVLTSIDLRSGRVDWQVDVGAGVVGRAAAVDDVIAVPVEGDRIVLLRRGADTPIGEAKTDGPVGDGLSALRDGFVVAGRAGMIRRLDLRGELLWRFVAGDAVGARAVRAEGRMLIVTRAGRVIALAD